VGIARCCTQLRQFWQLWQFLLSSERRFPENLIYLEALVRLTFALLLLCGIAGAQSGTTGAQSGTTGAQSGTVIDDMFEQRPLDYKPWDFGIWFGGGLSVPGGTKDTQAINAGVRLGKVLTGSHGGSFVRGNFEWSADLMPVYYVIQPAKNAYGAGLNPVNLKWNFTSHEHVVPYLELGGGVLFTNNEVPALTSTTNFLTHAALGMHFFTKEKRALTTSVRYEHISNAGLATPNPGVNTVQFTIGFNWFK
jgi:hypothetical protein